MRKLRNQKHSTLQNKKTFIPVGIIIIITTIICGKTWVNGQVLVE